MKLTDNDMAAPNFWATHMKAVKAVQDAVGVKLADDDKLAKAMSDAADALCKAMLIAGPRVAA